MSENRHSYILSMEVSIEVSVSEAIWKFKNLPLLAFVPFLKIEV